MKRGVAASFLMLLAGPAVAASELRDTRYLASAQFAAGAAFHGELREDLRAFVPIFGGSFGVRWDGDYELHLEIFHSSFDASLNGLPLDLGGLNQLGLAFNYSPRSFYGWFGSFRAGWLNGSVAPELSVNRMYTGVAVGYSWVPYEALDLRPSIGIQVLPTATLTGDQTWPVLSLGVQAVFKMERLADLFLNLVGARPRAL